MQTVLDTCPLVAVDINAYFIVDLDFVVLSWLLFVDFLSFYWYKCFMLCSPIRTCIYEIIGIFHVSEVWFGRSGPRTTAFLLKQGSAELLLNECGVA